MTQMVWLKESFHSHLLKTRYLRFPHMEQKQRGKQRKTQTELPRETFRSRTMLKSPQLVWGGQRAQGLEDGSGHQAT